MVKEGLKVMIALADQGTTAPCVTRETGVAHGGADRVVFMDRGRPVEDDTPDSVFADPGSGRTRELPGQAIRDHA